MRPRACYLSSVLAAFPPILMTTTAALFGALPLIISTGMGSELRRPLGITIVGGLIFSQALTLYTTPVVYLYFDRLREWWASRKRRPLLRRNRLLVFPTQSDQASASGLGKLARAQDLLPQTISKEAANIASAARSQNSPHAPSQSHSLIDKFTCANFEKGRAIHLYLGRNYWVSCGHDKGARPNTSRTAANKHASHADSSDGSGHRQIRISLPQ